MSRTDAPAFWYGGAPIPLWARVLEPAYRTLRAAHRAVYASRLRRPWRAPVPVIVVGNITAGGSGKTPLVLALVDLLRAQGRHPGVVSRGYGRSGRAACRVGAASSAAAVGDEPLLIHQCTGVPVAVAPRRAEAVRLLLDAGVDVIVADDGLQHAALARDLEIAVVDGVRRFGNGRLLPAGPLRDTPARLRRVDFVVCNNGTPAAGEFSMRLQPLPLEPVAPAAAGTAPPVPPAEVHAVAGLGDPQRFFATLRAQGYRVQAHPFPDHHAYRAADFAFDDGRLPLLMTGKDAVKCRALARAHWWVQPVRAELAAELRDALLVRLRKPDLAPR